MDFSICQILQEKLEYNGTVHHIMVHLKKGYESIRKDILYNILSDFGILMELVMLIKMCLNDTHSNAWIHICLICFLFRMV
jgi:hypothetical protein